MRRQAAVAASLATVLALSSCGSGDPVVPKSLCGTSIDPALSRPLLEPLNREVEQDGPVDRRAGETGHCIVWVGDDAAMEFWFAWGSGAPNLVELSGPDTTYRLTKVTPTDLGFEGVVGNEGAKAWTPCTTAGGDSFMLSVNFPRVDRMSAKLRPAIEKFMKAYMKNTVTTLGCGKPAVR
ncbi:hypothetical protein AB0J57_31745 [Streptomyces sp. NPDC049837]|uniref:hypothetical protein n=1 Tax=Streptomyces sp. NPDC049837 TaxID=3155277 RepID=UPI003428DEA3